ncbi:MAG TPA: GNAT family N-acetyltransferase [Casimicrobiaceae bacterium]|nr:GNAT family N-acetyltransferase [Casimicrobiaceae bacterium]
MIVIRQADAPVDFDAARRLFREYADWLNEDLCFQGFDAELAGLPGDYAPPRGRLLLAGPHDDPFGCIALRPLVMPGSPHPHATAEVKRLYVQPRGRGKRVGSTLARTLIDEARTIGYRMLKLDTLGRMMAARRLYADLGFVECAAYYVNPLAQPVYMELDLARVASQPR